MCVEGNVLLTSQFSSLVVEGACSSNNGVDENDILRAAKRQTIGRAAGAGRKGLGLGGMGGKGTKGGRSFVLRRVTLREEREDRERQVETETGPGMVMEMSSKGAGSNNSGYIHLQGSTVNGASVIQSGGGIRKKRSRANLCNRNGIHVGSRKADPGPGHNGHRKSNREKSREKEKSVGKRSWTDGSRNLTDSQSQGLRDEMLEYATSQMAAVDFGSARADASKDSSNDTGIGYERSKHTSSAGKSQHRNNHISTASSISQPKQSPVSKPVPKPKQKPKPKSKTTPKPKNEDNNTAGHSDKPTAGKSKADLKAAAIMQAFAIDTTSYDSNICKSKNDGGNTIENSNPQPNSQYGKEIQERKLKRPGASAAEKAWRLRNWTSQRLQQPRDVPVLMLAAGPEPGHKHKHRISNRLSSISMKDGTTATSVEDDMDIDSANNETTSIKNSVHPGGKKVDNGSDNDDDNSDIYDTYIREPKSHLVETAYKSVKIGYLTISDDHRNLDKHNKDYHHDNNNSINNNSNSSSTTANNTTYTTSNSAEQPKYDDSASSNYWSSVWDEWDAELELELEAEVEKRLQMKLKPSQEPQHHHQEQQYHQGHEIQPYQVQQLREHIRTQIQHEHRRANANFHTNNYSSYNKYFPYAYTYRNNNNRRDNQDDENDDLLTGSSTADEDDEDEDDDEEDENAENHWAADYPDEDLWDTGRVYGVDGDDEDDEDDVDDVDDVDGLEDGEKVGMRGRGRWNECFHVNKNNDEHDESESDTENESDTDSDNDSEKQQRQ